MSRTRRTLWPELLTRFIARRSALGTLAALAVACLFRTHPPAHGADATTPGADIASLKKSLESGLFCRRPVEFEFVALIVSLVENNTLSRQLVLETFHWARVKRPYPFVYFQFAIRQRAAKLGVTID